MVVRPHREENQSGRGSRLKHRAHGLPARAGRIEFRRQVPPELIAVRWHTVEEDARLVRRRPQRAIPARMRAPTVAAPENYPAESETRRYRGKAGRMAERIRAIQHVRCRRSQGTQYAAA